MEDPKGSLINNLLTRTDNETVAIELEISEFNLLNVTINVNAAEILNNDEEDDIDPEEFRQDVEYITKMCKYKFQQLDATISEKMRALDIIKTAITNKIALNQKDSLPSSRSSSATRSVNTRNNADSMKPATLSYNTTTLVLIADHLSSVQDWMLNMFPNGSTVDQYKSNLNSTLDQEFHRKTKKFDNCNTVIAIHKSIDKLMEIKHPIHLRRMDCIKPIMKPNKEASTYFSRIELDFENAKMDTCPATNLLAHVTLNSIPDTETFKKHRKHISK